MNFTGKVVIITGSSSGIGATAAAKFAKLGADVVINGRNKERLEKVAAEIAKVSPKKEKGVLQVIADLTKGEDCERLIKSSVEHFGKLDILVNNAGTIAVTDIHDSKVMDVYDKLMNIGLKTVVRMTHLAIPHLEKTKGSIINISVIPFVFPSYFGYSLAKSGINMFTRCMAVELGPKGIRVNTINPGFINTGKSGAMEMPKEMYDKLMDFMAKITPLRRIGNTEDIANAMVFLSSDDASFITGINLTSDGGAIWVYPQPESLKTHP